MSDAEIIQISEIDDSEPFSLKNDTFHDKKMEQAEKSYGGGISLLMNEKHKNEGTNTGIESLDAELNELNDDFSEKKIKSENRSTLFENALHSSDVLHDGYHSDKEESNNVRFNLGKDTVHNMETEGKTWDGFQTFKDVPLHPDMDEKPMTKEQLLKEKFKYVKLLEELEKKGAKLSKQYDMESNLAEMMGEYETLIDEKEKSNSVKFQGKVLMACITGLEFLNNKFDPFDIKLDGWGEQINENISDYDEIFEELHQKYKSKGKMAPELKLLFQLVGSGVMIHMSNSLFKSALPSMDGIMKQNPDLMREFTKAAATSMSGTSPGFSNLMGDMMSSTHREAPMSNMGQFSEPIQQPQRFANGPQRQERYHSNGPGMVYNNVTENTIRREMSGPSDDDVDTILASLKTKKIDIRNEGSESEGVNSSRISISELKELNGAKIPKSKGKGRRKKSDKNVSISLDI